MVPRRGKVDFSAPGDQASKGTVVSFVPTLFGCFLGIPSLYVFFVTCIYRCSPCDFAWVAWRLYCCLAVDEYPF